MATKALYRRTLQGWVPADPEAEAFMRGFKVGGFARLEGSKPRNVQHHRKFFAMMGIIFENQEHYKSIDELRAALCVAIGHADFVKTPHGIVGIPRSISFASMDQTAFNDFYERAIAWVLEAVIPGLERKGLDEAVAAELARF